MIKDYACTWHNAVIYRMGVQTSQGPDNHPDKFMEESLPWGHMDMPVHPHERVYRHVCMILGIEFLRYGGLWEKQEGICSIDRIAIWMSLPNPDVLCIHLGKVVPSGWTAGRGTMTYIYLLEVYSMVSCSSDYIIIQNTNDQFW